MIRPDETAREMRIRLEREEAERDEKRARQNSTFYSYLIALLAFTLILPFAPAPNQLLSMFVVLGLSFLLFSIAILKD